MGSFAALHRLHQFSGDFLYNYKQKYQYFSWMMIASLSISQYTGAKTLD
jgi:hypothetical protein